MAQPALTDCNCLFVYGTLRAKVEHPLHALILRHARSLGPAVFAGQLYDLGDYPGVIDADGPGELVHGEAYEFLGPADGAGTTVLLQELDAYEECGPGFAEPTEYLRVIRPVQLAAPVQTRSAWIYLYNHAQRLHGARHLPHGDYLQR